MKVADGEHLRGRKAVRAPRAPRSKIVGDFIRQRREALALSQRALGLLFEPAVTTQFISNVERGVTPLPPAHVPTLSRALKIADSEIFSLLEREYSQKLSGRLGGYVAASSQPSFAPKNPVAAQDQEFMSEVYEAFQQANAKARQEFMSLCRSALGLRGGRASDSESLAPSASEQRAASEQTR